MNLSGIPLLFLPFVEGFSLGQSIRRSDTPLHSTATSSEVSTSTASIPWTLNNEKYGEFNQHRDWGFAYSSTPPSACDSYTIDNIEGEIPKDLIGSGTLYKIGPGNFERGGCQYEHVFDGDGFVTAVSFREDGTVQYTGRFVETEYFSNERDENKVKYRNVFGTQRPGGVIANAFDLTLKNVANTNVLKWGGRLFVFWEAGRPYELDPETLETLCSVTEDGPLADLGGLDCKVRGITIDEGGPIDKLVNVGRSFTAHPHVWDENTLVGFKTETNAQTKDLTLEFLEYDADWNEKSSTMYSISDSPAPHDFSISDNYYTFFENPYGEMDNMKYIMGLKAPTQVMQLALRQNTKLHIVPRSKDDSKSKPMTVELPASYFNIHVNGIAEEVGGKLYLYSTGWDLTDERYFPQTQDTAPFLGAWGGPYPDFLGGTVPPTLLHQTVVDLETAKVISHEEICPGSVIEFPTQEEDRPNWMYCPIASVDYTSLPSTGLCRINTKTSEMETWWAENKCFTHEVITVKKKNGNPGSWLLTPLYDTEEKRVTLAIIDSEDFALGPICRLHLKHHVTYGLHGSFASSQTR